MKILAFSDLHTSTTLANRIVSQSSGADIVVGAGDFATKGHGLEPVMSALANIRKPMLLVPGNHESLAALKECTASWPNCHVLFGDTVHIKGQAFFGLGYETPRSNQYSWNRYLTEEEAAQALASCPTGAILITHAPPFGECDRQKDGRHDGSRAIRDAIIAKSPLLHLCGHIHASWGCRGQLAGCPVYNLGPRGQVIALSPPSPAEATRLSSE